MGYRQAVKAQRAKEINIGQIKRYSTTVSTTDFDSVGVGSTPTIAVSFPLTAVYDSSNLSSLAQLDNSHY